MHGNLSKLPISILLLKYNLEALPFGKSEKHLYHDGGAAQDVATQEPRVLAAVDKVNVIGRADTANNWYQSTFPRNSSGLLKHLPFGITLEAQFIHVQVIARRNGDLPLRGKIAPTFIVSHETSYTHPLLLLLPAFVNVSGNHYEIPRRIVMRYSKGSF